MKDNVWIDIVSFIVTTSPACYTSFVKQVVNTDKLICETDKIKIMNTLFQVKLQALTVDLEAFAACSIHRVYPAHFFSQNF